MLDLPFVKIAKALADSTRHQMLCEIRAAGELTCSAVCERFQLSQPTISHHIKTLIVAGVIHVRKEGSFHVLSVNEEVMRSFAADILPAPRARAAKKAASRPPSAPRSPRAAGAAPRRRTPAKPGR